MLVDVGMDAFAERARRELLATGETVRKRTVETLGELTTQEAQVARLAAGGQTNPQIGAPMFASPPPHAWAHTTVLRMPAMRSGKEVGCGLADVGAAAVSG